MRINKIKIEVLHCNKVVVVMAFCKDLLLDYKLYHSIMKTRPKTMVEVLKQAKKYINLKEELKVE